MQFPPEHRKEVIAYAKRYSVRKAATQFNHSQHTVKKWVDGKVATPRTTSDYVRTSRATQQRMKKMAKLA